MTFFAPRAHPAMKEIASVRRELGVRTLMNCLGPLLNPAGVRMQLVGVYAPELVEPLIEALGELGARPGARGARLGRPGRDYDLRADGCGATRGWSRHADRDQSFEPRDSQLRFGAHFAGVPPRKMPTSCAACSRARAVRGATSC